MLSAVCAMPWGRMRHLPARLPDLSARSPRGGRSADSPYAAHGRTVPSPAYPATPHRVYASGAPARAVLLRQSVDRRAPRESGGEELPQGGNAGAISAL